MRFLLPVIAMSAVIQAAPSIPRGVNSIVNTGVENVEDTVSKRSVDDFLDTMFTRLQNGTSTVADEISELVKQNINYYTLDTLQKQIENLEGTVKNKRAVDDVSDTVFQRLQGGTSQIADEVAKLVEHISTTTRSIRFRSRLRTWRAALASVLSRQAVSPR
ncbi:hypothetical protein KC316_g3013 [Hortaea werneckii]|nr:hypothetical protein KC324_g14606 [Hortaea werneckii]KAI7591157.1 hypothetical protein KC316_g3013 [Hortaea werneckii]